MVMRRAEDTHTSRRLARAIIARNNARKPRITAEEKVFRKRFGRIESEKFESILKNYGDSKTISFSKAVKRTLNWVRWMGFYRDSIIDGTYIPFRREVFYIKRILEQRKLIIKHLNSENETINMIGMRDAAILDLKETCPKIAEFLKHKDSRVRTEAVTTLGYMGYAKAFDQIKGLLEDENEGENVKLAAKSSLKMLERKN